MSSSRSLRHEPFTHGGINVYGIRSYSLGFFYDNFRFPLPIAIRKAITKEMKRFQPDVIHIQDHFVISPTVQKVANEMSIPMMGTNHFLPENFTHYMHLPKNLEQLVKNWLWAQFRKVFEQLHYVTTPTATAARHLQEVKLTKPVVPVSNGVDLQIFKLSNNGEYLRARLGIPNKPAILYVGRLDKEKNVDVVLRALAIARKRVDIHFIIAGKGAETKKLKALAESLGISDAVTFTGFVPDEDLPNLYRIADCFVIAGIAELQSLVTMEAMASGLPVIAVNAMALPELVKHGENGYLFELTEVNALAEHLVKLFTDEDLRKQMATKSLEMIQVHDVHKSMEIFESFYQKMLLKE